MMPRILRDIGQEDLYLKVSLNFLDQEKDKRKETSNITDCEHLHIETLYEKKTMDIFATPHKNKLG